MTINILRLHKITILVLDVCLLIVNDFHDLIGNG